jgi:hypothetical protein
MASPGSPHPGNPQRARIAPGAAEGAGAFALGPSWIFQATRDEAKAAFIALADP